MCGCGGGGGIYKANAHLLVKVQLRHQCRVADSVGLPVQLGCDVSGVAPQLLGRGGWAARRATRKKAHTEGEQAVSTMTRDMIGWQRCVVTTKQPTQSNQHSHSGGTSTHTAHAQSTSAHSREQSSAEHNTAQHTKHKEHCSAEPQHSTAQHSTPCTHNIHSTHSKHSAHSEQASRMPKRYHKHTAPHSPAQPRTAPHSPAQHRTAPHSTAQHRTAPHSTAQHRTAPHSHMPNTCRKYTAHTAQLAHRKHTAHNMEGGAAGIGQV